MKTMHCPHCRGLMQDDGTLSGTVQCPHCRGTFTMARTGTGAGPAPANLRPPAPPGSLAVGGAAPAPAIRTGAVGRIPRTSIWDVF